MTILKHYFNNLIKLFILTFFLGCAYSNSNRQVKSIIKVRNPYIDKVYDLEDTIYHSKEYHKNGYLNSERVYIYQKYDNVRIDTIIKNYKYSLNGQIVQENIYSQRTININDRTIHKKDTSFRYYKYEDDKLIMSKDSSKDLSSTSKFYFYNSEGIKIRETVITNSSGDSIVGLFDDQGYETRIFIKSLGASFSDEMIRPIASIYNYYNSKGQLSEQKFYDQLEKKFIHYTRYFYGKKNKLLKSIKVAYPGNKLRTSDMLFSADSIINLYDNQERLIKNASYNKQSNGVNFERATEYSYNKLGQVTEIKTYFINEKGYIPIQKKIFSYDESGSLIKEEWVLGNNEKFVYNYEYKYW